MGNASTTPRPVARTLCSRLIGLGLALLLPVLGLCAVLAPVHVEHQRDGLRAQAERLAHNASGDLVRELGAITATLETLVRSSLLDRAQLPEFKEYASRIARHQDVNIILRDPSGQIILNTGAALGVPLPRSTLSVEARKTLQANATYVSNVFVSSVRRIPIFIVSVPVQNGSFAGHTLNAGVEPAFLLRILADAAPPVPWVLALFDRAGALAASTVLTDPPFAEGLPAEVMARMTDDAGFVRTGLGAEDEYYLAYSRSPQNGWLAMVRLPAREWDAVAHDTYTAIAALTAGLLAISLAGAFVFARGIALPMQRLAQQAASLDGIEQPEPRRSGVREIDTVAERLRETAARLSRSTIELRLSEERYRLLAAASPAGIFQAGPAGHLTYVNATCSSLAGATPDAALGQLWIELLHADDRERVAADWQRCLAAAEPLQFECRMGGGGCTTVWVLGAIGIERDALGDVIGYAGSLVDLTLRKQAELARFEDESRLRLALELGGMGTGSWDLTSDRAFLDPLGASLYGIDVASEGVPFSQILDLVHPDDLAEVLEKLSTLKTTHHPVDIVERIRRPDGELRWLAIRAQHLQGPDAEAGRVLGVLFDITQQKLAEHNLAGLNNALELRVAVRTHELEVTNRQLQAEMKRREEAQAALLQAQKLEAVGQFTSGIAHDFNNELMIVMGGLELAMKDVVDERASRHLGNARKAAGRASQLTGQILSFAGGGDLAPEAVDVLEVLEDMSDALRHVAGSSVRLDLPAGAPFHPVWADRNELQAVLLNLAVNARDAMRDGGTLTIGLASIEPGNDRLPGQLAPGSYVAISVRDTGAGMPPEVLAKATEPFFTTKPRGRGTGLGLARAKAFAEQSRGTLVISSAEGAGTSVELFLPGAGPADRPPSRDAPSAFDGGTPPLTILCVDDNPQSAEITGELAHALGHSVLTAADPQAALRTAENLDALDLLVTDMDMPRMSGVELAAAMQRVRPGLAVLYITGHAVEAPPPDLLRKPFSEQDLARKIAEVMQRAKV